MKHKFPDIPRFHTKSFAQTLRRLKKRLPLPFPIKVDFQVLDCAGECQLLEGKKKRFAIVLDNELTEDMAIEVLIHEWAHALSWTFDRPDLKDHGPEFGVSWAKSYCAAMETK